MTLGRCGWQVARETDPRNLMDRFMFHHPKAGITATGRLKDPYRWSRSGNFRQEWDGMPIEIEHVASVGNFQFRNFNANLSAFHRIDTESMAIETEMGELHRLPLFAELFMARPEPQELIVEPQDVQQLLDQILTLQAPAMKDIRARDRKRDQPEKKQLHAQIISLAA